MAITLTENGASPTDQPVNPSDTTAPAAAPDSLPGPSLAEIPLQAIDPISPIRPISPASDASPGILQSTSPPDLVTALAGTARWDIDDAAEDFAKQQAEAEDLRDIDKVALDPDSFFKGKDLSFARTPQEARILAVNTAFMEFASGNGPVPFDQSDVLRGIQRRQIANRCFGGRGAENEQAFHAEIVKAATTRKQAADIRDTVHASARTAAAMQEEAPAHPGESWTAARDKARAMPGYNKDDEAALFNDFYEARQARQRAIAPFSPQLKTIWQAMKPAASPASPAAPASLAAAPSATAQDLGTLTYGIYQNLPENQRPGFMTGLASLVESLPEDQRQPALARLLTRSSAPASARFPTADPGRPGSMLYPSPERMDQLLQKNYTDDLRRIANGAPPASDPRVSDPAVAATMGTVLLPGMGPAAPYLSLQDTAGHDLFAQAKARGDSDTQARLIADQGKSRAAAPRIAAGVFQAYLPPADLAAVQPLLDTLAANVTGGILAPLSAAAPVSAAVSTIPGGNPAPVLPDTIRHIGDAISHLPGAAYTGEGGAFDGAWTANSATYASLLPLASGATLGSLSEDTRNRAFSTASPTELAAFGATAEDIAALQAAAGKGKSAVTSAIGQLMARRDPDSPAAQAAVASLATVQAEKEQATRTLIDHGFLPGSTSNSDGTTTYYDSRTGREIATTRAWQEASLLTHSHAHFYEQREGDRVAAGLQAPILTLADNPSFSDEEKININLGELKRIHSNTYETVKNPGLLGKNIAIIDHNKAKLNLLLAQGEIHHRWKTDAEKEKFIADFHKQSITPYLKAAQEDYATAKKLGPRAGANQTAAYERRLVSDFIGTSTHAQELSGAAVGTYQKIKGGANDILSGDVSEKVSKALLGGGGDIDKAIAYAKANMQETVATYSGGSMGSYGYMGSTSQSVESPAIARLIELKARLDKAGIPPERRIALLTDTAAADAWTENDTDRVRKLSTDELVINPGRVFGDRQGIIDEINASDTDDANKQLALLKYEAMRASMAEAMETTLHYGDHSEDAGLFLSAAIPFPGSRELLNKAAEATGMKNPAANGGFAGFSQRKNAEGVRDKARILDEWSKIQNDRNWLFKVEGAIHTGLVTGSIGISETVVGAGAGASALVGADRLAGYLGEKQMFLGDSSDQVSQAAEFGGEKGVYEIVSGLTNTVVQMAPMFAGGQVAVGLSGVSKVVVQGMSVYGWSAAQGYESKLKDALDMARQTKGSALTKDEIANILGDPKTQVAGFLNGAQTAVLAKVLGGGVEKAALGKAAETMTFKQFIAKGGEKALRDSPLKNELRIMAKSIFAGAGDEALEEFTNQMLDDIISVGVLGQDMKLGEVFEKAFKSGAMGGLLGGALPAVRKAGAGRGTSPDLAAALEGKGAPPGGFSTSPDQLRFSQQSTTTTLSAAELTHLVRAKEIHGGGNGRITDLLLPGAPAPAPPTPETKATDSTSGSAEFIPREPAVSPASQTDPAQSSPAPEATSPAPETQSTAPGKPVPATQPADSTTGSAEFIPREPAGNSDSQTDLVPASPASEASQPAPSRPATEENPGNSTPESQPATTESHPAPSSESTAESHPTTPAAPDASEAIARSADRLRTGEPVSTVLQDDVRETLQQANDRGIFPVADCVRILQAADQVAARQATRDGTPHQSLLPENFHQLTPDQQASVVREQMPRLFSSEILRTPQDGATGPALPPGFISQNQSAISQHAGERAAGNFRAFTTALRARLELSITQANEGDFSFSPETETGVSEAGSEVHDGASSEDERPVGGRLSKLRKREAHSQPARWAAVAGKIYKSVSRQAAKVPYELGVRSSAKKGVDRSRLLFDEECPLTPEESEILASPLEIVLVHTAEGRLHTTKLGKRSRCVIPDDIPADAIITHNHPSGSGPSIEDILIALKNPGFIMRVITKNPNGKTEIWQFSAKTTLTSEDIKDIKDFFTEIRDDNGGLTIRGNREALELTLEEFSDKLKVTNRIHS